MSSRWREFKASLKPTIKEWKFMLKRLSESPLSIAGVAILSGFIVIAAFAPILAPPQSDNPFMIPRDWRLLRVGVLDPIPPTLDHPFGTIEGQYDLYYGCIWGTITAFRIGILVVAGALFIGLSVGMTSGYYTGLVDETLMRFTDIIIAFPGLVLAMALTIALPNVMQVSLSLFLCVIFALLSLTALVLRANPRITAISGALFVITLLSNLYFPWTVNMSITNLDKVMIALVLVGWPGYARVIRGEVLRVRSEDYIEAARASGCSDLRIITKHIIPNSVYPVLIMASLDTGAIVLSAAALSFLGLGADQGYADWGQVINMSQHWIGVTNVPLTEYIHAFMIPGFMIFMFVLAWNLLGDAIRDVLDPMIRRR